MMVSFVLSILIIVALFTGGEFSNSLDADIDQLLKKLNKPALKSIESPDGDIIDCVHMKNHPIYDHPLFKNHTIQMKPSSYPKGCNNQLSKTYNQSVVTQLWTINGKCPKNSIPIRRTKREDILRVGSIERYMKKYPNNISRPKSGNSTNDGLHEYAQINVDGRFRGGRAMINAWKPYVQTTKEFSLAQIWIVAGPPSTLNTMEYGWQTYPDRYGDNNPRHFIYWTVDGYNTTGCYNVECAGFVPVNQEFALGAVVSPVSIMNGEQYHIPATIWKDPISGNWWLQIGLHLLIGYWPALLFNHLRNEATLIQLGGEITNFRDNSQHTTTAMGSGRFASEGFQKASYFKNIETFDEFNIWRPIQGAYTIMTHESCYNIRLGYEIDWGHYFFYGGPGRNENCV